MLVQRVKKLVGIIEELVNFDEDVMNRLDFIKQLDDRIDHEDVILLQAIIYICREERLPDPIELTSFKNKILNTFELTVSEEKWEHLKNRFLQSI